VLGSYSRSYAPGLGVGVGGYGVTVILSFLRAWVRGVVRDVLRGAVRGSLAMGSAP